jgi:hypothetical protein
MTEADGGGSCQFAGMLVLCRDGQLAAPGGACAGPVSVAFTIDTTKPEGTIEIDLP